MKLLAIAVALLTGCVSQNDALRRATAGHVGCQPHEIEIQNADGGTWTAICRDRVYYCSRDQASTAEYLVLGVDRATAAHSQQVVCSRDESGGLASRSGPAFTPGIRTSHDPFDRTTTIVLRLGDSSRRLILSGSPDRDGVVHLAIGHRGIGFSDCRNVDVLAGEETLQIAQRAPLKNLSDHWEALSTPIPLAAIEQMANSLRAAARACKESVLVRQDTLQAFLKRWHEFAKAPAADASATHAPAEGTAGEPTAAHANAEAAGQSSAPEPASAPTAPSVPGCQFDTQCKGERICVAGQCVDAPAITR